MHFYLIAVNLDNPPLAARIELPATAAPPVTRTALFDVPS